MIIKDVKKFPDEERENLTQNALYSLTHGSWNIISSERVYSCTAWLKKCETVSPITGELLPAYILQSYNTYIALFIDGDIYDLLLPMYGERTRTSISHISKATKLLNSRGIFFGTCYKF